MRHYPHPYKVAGERPGWVVGAGWLLFAAALWAGCRWALKRAQRR